MLTYRFTIINNTTSLHFFELQNNAKLIKLLMAVNLYVSTEMQTVPNGIYPRARQKNTKVQDMAGGHIVWSLKTVPLLHLDSIQQKFLSWVGMANTSHSHNFLFL